MSIIRTYFTKNNTIITDNRINNSQNPVTEISYGLNNNVSRFLFDVDLDKLKDRILSIGLDSNKIVSHKLKMQNTVHEYEQYLGGYFRDKETQRTSSFLLDLFKVDEEWDEGNGYEFYYNENEPLNPIYSASNWYYKKTNEEWETEGYFNTGDTQIINSQYFDNGNENIDMDVTEYINDYIYSGNTTHKGFGLKFDNELESLITKYRQAVAFHTKYTHTFFKPYIETVIDDNIVDDRDRFYIDEDNYLYLFYKEKGVYKDIIVNNVTILDYNGEITENFTFNNIEKIKNGIYRVKYNVDSNNYPDRVIFYDNWDVSVDGVSKNIKQRFYIKPNINYYDFNNNSLNPDNFHITINGIKQDEVIKNNQSRFISLDVRKLYEYDDDLELYYDLYIKLSGEHRIDVIKDELINRYNNKHGFEINFDWLVSQEYYLDIYIGDGDYRYLNNTLRFKKNTDF